MKTCRNALLALLLLLSPPAVAQTAVPMEAAPAPAAAAPAPPAQDQAALYALVGIGVLVSAALGVGAVVTTSKGVLV